MLVLVDSFWAYGWILASLIAYFIIPFLGWRVAMVMASLFALYS
ncbi:putative membrane protein [Lactovum miscens]|uniref:Putative membrane protein n=1 Tax=Lactovum miscens TaxID=190387 RepID=A0A841C438_9LACT|nr:putative membrane protein [Lactovum miscens]